MSKSASLPADQFDHFDQQSYDSTTPAWKQEVNQRLAAHRTRRGGLQEAQPASQPAESVRSASSRAAEAAARVAARYAKAPSYSELLAGEARAVVRAAGAAAEAARNAQAAAQAVLAGLESAPIASGRWEPAPQAVANAVQAAHARVATPIEAPIIQASAATVEIEPSPAVSSTPQLSAPRWQDQPPAPAEHAAAPQTAPENPWAGAQPRWQEELPVASSSSSDRDIWSEMRLHPSTSSKESSDNGSLDARHYVQDTDEHELFPYDIADSHDPIGSATVQPVQNIPANLIEFPRELIATRKARPRLAEGPFHEAAQESPQLNIFEVDPEQLAAPIYLSDVHLSDPASETVAPPEWASIELDQYAAEFGDTAHSLSTYEEHPFAGPAPLVSSYDYPPMQAQMQAQLTPSAPPAAAETVLQPRAQAIASPAGAKQPTAAVAPESTSEAAPAAELLVAPMSDRLLASVVDGALITLAFVAASVVVIASTAHPPSGHLALIATGCGLALFALLYQFLFLSYAEEGTPGMRYARIALCTFDDDNPTREQMRRRIPALLLAWLPAGLGLAWALVDKDHLGLHDRLTRTYQRKY